MTLPHQQNDIKPDELVSPEEEMPEEFVDPWRKEEALMHLRVQEAHKILLKEEEKLRKKKNKIDNHFEEIKKIIA